MKRMEYNQVAEAVRVFAGSLKRCGKHDEASAVNAEWEKIRLLAETNFAACADPHTAACALQPRMPMITGGGQLMTEVLRWLFSKAKEKCDCTAPTYITGCDNCVTLDGGRNRCSAPDCGCPFIHHTRTFE